MPFRVQWHNILPYIRTMGLKFKYALTEGAEECHDKAKFKLRHCNAHQLTPVRPSHRCQKTGSPLHTNNPLFPSYHMHTHALGGALC